MKRLMKRNPLRRILLLQVIVLLVLSVSTGCTSTQQVSRTEEISEDWRAFVSTMVSMIPKLPELPSFPVLHWTYRDGLYGLEEEDADRLLDYGENALPLYVHEMNTYREKLDAVLSYLSVDCKPKESDV